MSVALVGVRKNENGQITHFLTDDGRTITFNEAKELVNNGEVSSLTEIYEDGSWVMNLEESSTTGDNLDNLPSF